MREGGSYIIHQDGDEPELVERTENPADGVAHARPPEADGAPAEDAAEGASARRKRRASPNTTTAAPTETQE